MNTRDLTPGDRRELRSLVKKQFAVLRNDVKRREQELRGEIEAALLRKYRAEDQRVNEAREQARRAYSDFLLDLNKIMDDLRADCPELEVESSRKYGGSPADIAASNPQRSQEHRALVASIPQQVANASTKLDQDELDLLRDLTVGALTSDQATEFLGRIPTVGVLVPKARLAELEDGAS